MTYAKLFLLSFLCLTPAFAQSSYHCEQETDGKALLGESFQVEVGDEAVALSSQEIGICAAEEGELSGQTCSVAETVSISLHDGLDAGESTGYVYAYDEDEAEVLYYCEAGRK